MLQKFTSYWNSEPSQVAIRFREQVLTYQELLIEAVALGQLLRPDVPAVYLEEENPLLFFPKFFAALLADVPVVVGSKAFTPQQKQLVCEVHGLIGFEEALSATEHPVSFAKPAEQRFLGVLSSGSTGTPKIIWKDYQSWFSAFSHQTDIFDIRPSDTLFVVDALGYSANLNAALHQLWQGGEVVFGQLASAGQWAQLWQKAGVSAAFLVPSHLRLMADNLRAVPTLKRLVTAGEKLDMATALAVLDNCPEVLLTEYYGAAELGHISYHQNQDIIRYPNSVGRAFPEVNITIQENQIVVKSPYVSPEFRGQNTVHDLGFFEENRLVLLGRAGRMFVKRGLNIYAQEIESIALQVPQVKAAALLSITSVPSSNPLILFCEIGINCQYDTRLIKSKIRQFLLEKLPIAKQPRKIQLAEVFPRLANGKIDYLLLEEIWTKQQPEADVM